MERDKFDLTATADIRDAYSEGAAEARATLISERALELRRRGMLALVPAPHVTPAAEPRPSWIRRATLGVFAAALLGSTTVALGYLAGLAVEVLR